MAVTSGGRWLTVRVGISSVEPSGAGSCLCTLKTPCCLSFATGQVAGGAGFGNSGGQRWDKLQGTNQVAGRSRALFKMAAAAFRGPF